MSPSTSVLEYGRHVARLRRRRRCRRRRAHVPTSNTASHDNHEKITNGFLFFPVMKMGLRFPALRAAGAPLKNPSALTDLSMGQFTTTMGHDNLK